ncbi:hypothetical protein O181_079328 [Austropuccinia psidii MF-1]|uniref:Uncharacterized protein n=1 Tax=Austropuccinia psidii MF-1 TaxID=1389203 RepID=A0A9Q3FGH1_9BASI|nr:hypothetical protein [Austropuccinia psidii MF-1]
MSSKLTELIESSPSAPHHLFFVGLASSVDWLHLGKWLPLGTLILVKLMMDKRQLRPCCCPGPADFIIRRYLWSKKDGPFGKEFPASEGPTSDGTSGYSDLTGSRQRDVARWTNVGGPIPVGGRPIYSSSAVTISRINTEGVVKKITRTANSPPDPDAEGSDELDGEEVEVVNNPVGNQSSTSPSQPPSKKFQSHLIPSTPRNFQPTLATIPPTPGLP